MNHKFCFLFCLFGFFLFEALYPRIHAEFDVERAFWAGLFVGFLGWIGLVLDEQQKRFGGPRVF